MKKNKGFTLVELLAVIAILAILVIMALPAVLRMYRQSRINNFQNEVRSTYRTAQSQFLGDSILLGSGQKILYTNGCNSSSDADVVKSLDMTGNSNFKYYVLIDVDGKVLEVRSSNGTYSYSKTGSDLKVEDMDVETYNDSTLDSDISSTICTMESSGGSGSNSGSGSNTPSATNVATVVEGQTCEKTDVGCEVTVGGENFYVVSSDSTNTKLLAKYALDTASNTQTTDTTGSTTPTAGKYTEMAFSSVGYWDGAQCAHNGSWSCPGTSGLLSPYNANGASYNGNPYPFVYDSNSSLKTAVDAYANKIGTEAGTTVTGTLMTYEEASGLDSSIRNCGQVYWLGSAYSYRRVCSVDYFGSFNDYGLNFTRGVRPVIIVSTSAI